jgi:hypothetical protein
MATETPPPSRNRLPDWILGPSCVCGIPSLVFQSLRPLPAYFLRPYLFPRQGCRLWPQFLGNGHEKRIRAVLPIRLWGLDCQRRPCMEASLNHECEPERRIAQRRSFLSAPMTARRFCNFRDQRNNVQGRKHIYGPNGREGETLTALVRFISVSR